ncbi:3 beta-hydroxysteroid dehydrogenase type 7-like [Rhinoraja longicauda]
MGQLSFARRCGGRIFRLGPPSIHTARVYVGNVAWMHLLASRALRRDPGLVGGEAYFCYDSSPERSHLDLNLELLGPAGVHVVGLKRPVLPFGLVYLLALLLEALSFLLRPFFAFYPILNRFTLGAASTPFTVRTDKAERHLGYRPAYTWEEARDRTAGWLKDQA